MPVAAVLAVLLSVAEPPQTGVVAGPSPTADSPPAAVAPSASASTSHEERSRMVGLQFGAGFPEGLSVAGVLRPLPWLRGDLGVGFNVLSWGVLGGVTFAPWSGPVVPTLRLAGGQFFKTDLRDEFAGTFPDAFDPALRNFGYHFYSAQVGLEMGNDNGLLFFVRGGLAWIRSDLDSTTYTEGDTTVTANQNELSATTPSLQLGIVWHLW